MSAVIHALKIVRSFVEERKSANEVLNLARLCGMPLVSHLRDVSPDDCRRAQDELKKDVGIFDLTSLSTSSAKILLDHMIKRLGG